MENAEDKILKYSKKWEETDKAIISWNMKMCIRRYNCNIGKSEKEIISVIAKLMAENVNTVYAWFNPSRQKVKIPFLKMCKFVRLIDADIDEMFTPIYPLK